MADEAKDLEKQAKDKADAGDNKGAGEKYSEAAKKRSDEGDSKAAYKDYELAGDQFRKQGDELAEAQAYQAAGDEMMKLGDSLDGDIAHAKRLAVRATGRAIAYEKKSDPQDGHSKEDDQKAADEYDKAAKAYDVEAGVADAQADAYQNALLSYAKAQAAATSRVATLKAMHQETKAAQAMADALTIESLLLTLEVQAVSQTAKEAKDAKVKAEDKAKHEREEAAKAK